MLIPKLRISNTKASDNKNKVYDMVLNNMIMVNYQMLFLKMSQKKQTNNPFIYCNSEFKETL